MRYTEYDDDNDDVRYSLVGNTLYLSIIPRFDSQAIHFLLLDANSRTNFQLHPPNHPIHGSRGCLGCCTKTPFVTTDNKLTENLGKGQLTRKRSIFEDFCSSSTYEMDYSLPQSQISASSTSNTAVDAQCWSGSNPSEFVNRGLLLWNQTRQQWIGAMAPEHNKKTRQSVISWNATYDNLLGSNKPFSRPIPLPGSIFSIRTWHLISDETDETKSEGIGKCMEQI
ncbi:hypothetical protein R6Q57_016843 [Mikania cordata]